MSLPSWVKEGVAFRYVYPEDNHHNGRKFHVRGIVDGLAVIREWRPSKQRWNYTVEGEAYFDAFAPHIERLRK